MAAFHTAHYKDTVNMSRRDNVKSTWSPERFALAAAKAIAPSEVAQEYFAARAAANAQTMSEDPSTAVDGDELTMALLGEGAMAEKEFESDLVKQLAAGGITPDGMKARRLERRAAADKNFEEKLKKAVEAKQLTRTEALALRRERRTALASLEGQAKVAAETEATRDEIREALVGTAAAPGTSLAQQLSDLRNAVSAPGETLADKLDQVRDAVSASGTPLGTLVGKDTTSYQKIHMDELGKLWKDAGGSSGKLGPHIGNISYPGSTKRADLVATSKLEFAKFLHAAVNAREIAAVYPSGGAVRDRIVILGPPIDNTVPHAREVLAQGTTTDFVNALKGALSSLAPGSPGKFPTGNPLSTQLDALASSGAYAPMLRAYHTGSGLGLGHGLGEEEAPQRPKRENTLRVKRGRPSNRPDQAARRHIADTLLQQSIGDLEGARRLYFSLREKDIFSHQELSGLATLLQEEHERQHHAAGGRGRGRPLRLRMPLEKVKAIEGEGLVLPVI